MLRGSVVLVAGVVLVAASGAGARPDAASPPQVARSADGALTVSVPRGALTRDVQVRVRTLTATQTPAELRRLRLGGTIHELLPAGLRFAKPVTITKRVDARRAGFDVRRGMPVLVLGVGDRPGRWELLADQRARLAGATLTVTGRTRHFSPVAAFGGGPAIELRPRIVSRIVGETWTSALVLVRRAQTEIRWDTLPLHAGGVGPRGIAVVVRETTGPSRAPEVTFRCVAPGRDSFWVAGNLEEVVDDQFAILFARLEDARLYVQIHGTITCGGSDPLVAVRSTCVAVSHERFGAFPSSLRGRIVFDPANLPDDASLHIRISGANGDEEIVVPISADGHAKFEAGITSFGEKRLVSARIVALPALRVDEIDVTNAVRSRLGRLDVTAAEGVIAGSGCQ